MRAQQVIRQTPFQLISRSEIGVPALGGEGMIPSFHENQKRLAQSGSRGYNPNGALWPGPAGFDLHLIRIGQVGNRQGH